MLAEQQAYLHAWFDAVISAGFKAGMYCSGVPFKEGAGSDGGDRAATSTSTQKGARSHLGLQRHLRAVVEGVCFQSIRHRPAKSGIPYAEIWQFAQSPRRDEAKGCPKNYNADGNCYPPELPVEAATHVDVNTATTADPSRGR